MALTERYVTQASAGGTGTIGDPWDFATAITNAVAGDRVNIQSDGAYSIGATTFGAGTFDAPIIWRGYDVTIGDCDNLGRNANGTLNTTGMPAITVTGIWVPAAHIVLQNLDITAALSSAIVSSSLIDSVSIVSCKFENTQSNSSARCVLSDDRLILVNSDFSCTGATSDYVLSADYTLRILGCRFEIASTSECVIAIFGPIVVDSVFRKTGSLGGTGIQLDFVDGGSTFISGCTFYNFTNAILSTVTHTLGTFLLTNNHCTDCTQFVNNTTNTTCFDIQNRTRDNTSPPATVELITVGAITTDAGDETSDFVDASTGDFHLLTTAAGYNAGWDNADIGGSQTDPPAGGGVAIVNTRRNSLIGR